MPATLCAICAGIFAGGHTLKQEQPHHGSPDDFLAAARDGCYICRNITTSSGWNSVKAEQPYQQAVWYLCPLPECPPGWLRLSIDCLGDEDGGGSESESESRSGYKPLSPAWGFDLQPVDGQDIRYVTNVEMLLFTNTIRYECDERIQSPSNWIRGSRHVQSSKNLA